MVAEGRLEVKKINGHKYYYYAEWGWVNGKCRRLWQKYLGKPDAILKAVEGKSTPPAYAEVFEWGLSTALYQECKTAKIADIVNEVCTKRDQGMSIGEYIIIAGINRAMGAVSKASTWEWFSKTSLLRHFPKVSKSALTSQRFWDHMDKISSDQTKKIWSKILQGVIKREGVDLSSISYDGTNFYTFIDTFNVRCDIAKRGKNKQGRNNLRQVSYALFCSADSHIPLYYDIYDGNRNDARQFPIMLEGFYSFFKNLSGKDRPVPPTTIIFDKGNNSNDNFMLIDSLKLNFVGSVKLGEHKALAEISNNDERFTACTTTGLEKSKSFKVEKLVYGKKRTVLITYNQNLFDSQHMTLQNDLSTALTKLSGLSSKLEDRRDGLVTKGRSPTLSSVQKQAKDIVSRQYMSKIINIEVSQDVGEKIPSISYSLDNQAVQQLCDTYLGKNILVTSQSEWEQDRVIKAYRSQFIVENVFKEMKDRTEGSWWPMCHWTDSKIRVHALYCTISLLIRALLLRRAQEAKIKISLKRLLASLREIKEVVNVFPKKGKEAKGQCQTTLTELSELQEKILKTLNISR
jgi:transposase